jgi:hypothetical protein
VAHEQTWQGPRQNTACGVRRGAACVVWLHPVGGRSYGAVMDLEYYAWRRFAPAWPLLAAVAVIFVPGVHEWLTGVLVEHALTRAERVTGWMLDLVVQPMIDSAFERPAAQ